jgi:hypothetical protein
LVGGHVSQDANGTIMIAPFATAFQEDASDPDSISYIDMGWNKKILQDFATS